MITIAQHLNIKNFPFEIKDKNGNTIYYENSNGYSWKQEFDSNNNRIYHEDSHGYIVDNRAIPEYTMEELVAKLGNFKIIK